ncbi:Pleckstrin domain superfamily protein isoform 3 [Gossypium australe]|uniref:Pleckstrin domain superfamily protein isoform 3 n=1 Tax=Gossypium australe TaxID=47621 RepID=A0A5B6VIT8_9ROSI|nr:Pleckstrin domain superfamily protein isoform 3 [Gossypium australe]
MRLISLDTSKELPPMREVRCASSLGKVVMQVGQLNQVNATRSVHSKHSGSVLHSNLLTWQERKGPFEVLKQGGRETVGNLKPSIMNQKDSVRSKLECGSYYILIHGLQFHNKRVIAGSPFDAQKAESSQQKLTAKPALDPQRAELSWQHVKALNTQFASWVQSQLKNHPDELWQDGVQDYLTHALNIMVTSDVFSSTFEVFMVMNVQFVTVFDCKFMALVID